MKHRVCAFFDFQNFEEDKEDFEETLERFNASHGYAIENVLVTSDVQELRKKISSCNVCFIDFGGLDCGGMSGLLDSTVRAFEKLIIENENKIFIFVLSMPVEFYIGEDILKQPNVMKMERWDLQEGLQNIFSKIGI